MENPQELNSGPWAGFVTNAWVNEAREQSMHTVSRGVRASNTQSCCNCTTLFLVWQCYRLRKQGPSGMQQWKDTRVGMRKLELLVYCLRLRLWVCACLNNCPEVGTVSTSMRHKRLWDHDTVSVLCELCFVNRVSACFVNCPWMQETVPRGSD